MRHVHIVSPYESAAMMRMSAPLEKWLANAYNVTKSAEVDVNADLNIHIPFHTLIGLEEKGEGKHIAVYTHCNAGAEQSVIDACERADIVTAMSFTGRNELLNMGVDPKKIWVVYCAADGFQYRKRILGIIGYRQPNGRKNENLLIDLAWNYDLSPYEFIFTGLGWEDTVEQLKSLGVTAIEQHADTWEKLITNMRFMDALLVTGHREGGPLPLLECMGLGVPVLAPNVGYAADLLDEQYIYKDSDDLMNKLSDLFSVSMYHHQLARAWSWSDYAKEYNLLINQLLGESVEILPESGMNRYAQLLDVIDEVKPQSICEIGTWNGNRAIQMIQRASMYKPVSEIYYQGFDLFESQTQEQYNRELSKMGQPEMVVKKRIAATEANIELFKGDTSLTLSKSRKLFDIVFVDGGHSEKTIDNDGTWAIGRLFNKEVAIFDDYYHEGKPDGMGCNKFIDNLDRNVYEVTHLPVRTMAENGRLIGMVKVRRHADIRLQRQETYTANNTWYERSSFSVV